MLKFFKAGIEESYRSELLLEVDGIKICGNKANADYYLDTIVSSLSLIKEYDSRRYNILKREISWVVNSDVPSEYGARYIRSLKSCLINYVRFGNDQRFRSAFFAGILVHEATHGLLHTKGFDYSKKRRFQIERICTAEKNRFLKKMETAFPSYKGNLAGDFHPQNWDYVWNTPKIIQIFSYFKRRYSKKNG